MLTACYVRVSTEEQNLERQLQNVQSYAEEKLETELSDLQIFRDKINWNGYLSVRISGYDGHTGRERY